MLLALALVLAAAPAWAFTVTLAESQDLGGSHPSYTATLPASVAAGDLLIVCGAFDTNITAVAWAAGWNELYDVDHANVVGSCAYKIAAGGETTVVATATGTSDGVAFHAYRIQAGTWHGTTPPEVGTAATASSTNADPPSVTASWGSAANLFIAVASYGAAVSISAGPANYTGLDVHGTDSAIATARRELTAASDDPGTFTNSSTSWVTNTIVVRPGGAPCVARIMLTGIGGCN